MVTYEIEEQKRRELIDQLCKEWNAKFSSSKRYYSYAECTPISELTKKNERKDDDDSGGYTLFGIRY